MTERILRELQEVRAVYPLLDRVEKRRKAVVVSGTLVLDATHPQYGRIVDCYETEISIPHTYPYHLPEVREIGEKISRKDVNYQHFLSDGSLCLAVQIEKQIIFNQQPSLIGFVERLVVPYYYGYSCYKRFGKDPFGEATHGPRGVVDYYTNTLRMESEPEILGAVSFLLRKLTGRTRRRHVSLDVPLSMQQCDQRALQTLYDNHTRHSVRSDLYPVVQVCMDEFRQGKQVPLWARGELDQALRQHPRADQARIYLDKFFAGRYGTVDKRIEESLLKAGILGGVFSS